MSPLILLADLPSVLADMRIEEPLLTAMIASDYLSGHPVLIALDQRRVHFTSGASVSHQCIFYEHDQLDVRSSLLPLILVRLAADGILLAREPTGIGHSFGRPAGECVR